MRREWSAVEFGRATWLRVAGAVTAVTFAAVVYSQFNLYDHLSRDSAIYLYGGQRFTHGVPPYASIMDPKGPVSAILSGFAVALARVLGINDLLVTRAAFCALAIIGVFGVYLLVLELWQSVVGGVVAAAVFTSFARFAHQALVGPDGHTPGIVFLIFAMWLTVRRKWYWAGVAASLAFFSWQPLFAYPVIVTLCAVVWSSGQRLRAARWSLAGCATPFVLLIIYYAAAGYPGKLFEGAFAFPLTGTYRPLRTFGTRWHYIFKNIHQWYGSSTILLWTGLVLLVVVAVWTVVSAGSQWRAALLSPVILLVMLSLLSQVAYVLYDYIGGTHAFPLLPYSAMGFGATTAYMVEHASWPGLVRRVASVTLVAAAFALTAAAAVAYYQPSNDSDLRNEKASACAVAASVAPRTTLWTLDDPIPLVMLHRANPDAYSYVGSGLAEWRVKHTPGGLASWTAQIKASASVVIVDHWRERIPIRHEMMRWLRADGYRRGYIGQFEVFVTRAARARMAARSIMLTRTSHDSPLTTTGGTYGFVDCTSVSAG